MRRAIRSRATWTSEEEAQEDVQEANTPDALPLRGLRKALSQPNRRRGTNPSLSGADNNTFPALLTVWAAGTLLFKKRGSGNSIGTSGEVSLRVLEGWMMKCLHHMCLCCTFMRHFCEQGLLQLSSVPNLVYSILAVNMWCTTAINFLVDTDKRIHVDTFACFFLALKRKL